MDLMRRNASGRLSELAGPITLPQDRFMRTLGLREAAEAELATLPPNVRRLFDAYARGVNAWIARRGRFAAPEFLPFGAPKPWSAVDSLLWGKTMALYLAGNLRAELARLALSRTTSKTAIDALWPPVSGDHADAQAAADPALAKTALRLAETIPAFPRPFTLPDTASNAWAVDGRHSSSGAPLLAGDPHLAFSLPGIWYLARIDLADGTTLVGATAPGVPMLVLGHNGKIAWTFTTTGADTQDLFVETPLPGGEYATPEGPQPFQVREERIRVRGAADQVLRVRSSRHGPVISDLIDPNGPVLAFSAVELKPGDTAAAGLLALNHAGSVADAMSAAAAITSPVQNLFVADRDAIGLAVTGRVPVRKSGDGRWPEQGADGTHDWVGFASGDQLPRFVDPPSGRLVNANEPLAPVPGGAYLGGDGFGDFRARRIRALLGTAERHSVENFAAKQVDVLDTMATDLLPRLEKVSATSKLSREALDLLRSWDGKAVIDAPQPLIFNAWVRSFADLLLQRLGVPPEARAAAAPWPDLAERALSSGGAVLCPGDCDQLLSESLRASTDALAQRYGADPGAWRWGRAHQAVFAHPLLRAVPILGWLVAGRIAAPGDETTIDRGGFWPGGFADVHGPSFRGVYDLADLERSRFVMAPGQSGNPFSPLARNFLRRWRDGATITIGADAGPGVRHIALEPQGAIR
jgi:penicillin amidase